MQACNRREMAGPWDACLGRSTGGPLFRIDVIGGLLRQPAADNARVLLSSTCRQASERRSANRDMSLHSESMGRTGMTSRAVEPQRDVDLLVLCDITRMSTPTALFDLAARCMQLRCALARRLRRRRLRARVRIEAGVRGLVRCRANCPAHASVCSGVAAAAPEVFRWHCDTNCSGRARTQPSSCRRGRKGGRWLRRGATARLCHLGARLRSVIGPTAPAACPALRLRARRCW